MSKWIEYLKLIPKGLSNPEVIIEGWYNDIKLQFNSLPEDEVNEILRRRLICNSCPFNSVLAKSSEEYKKLYGENYKTDRQELHCSHCGCPIGTKSASLTSDCGITSYNEKYPENLQELKWNKYK